MKKLCRFFKALRKKDLARPDHFELADLLKSLPGSVYWKDLTGVYQGCNESMAKMIGLANPDAIIGKTDYDICWHKQADTLRSIDIEIIQSGIEKTVNEVLQLANEKLAIFQSTKRPLRNKQGKIIGILCLSTKVFNPQHEKEFLKNAKYNSIWQEIAQDCVLLEDYIESIGAYYEEIIACMPGNVYWMDKNCNYLGCNNNVISVLGLKSRNEILGKNYEDFARIANLSSNQVISFKKDDEEVMTTGIPKLGVEEPPLPGIDGKLIYYLTSRVPLRDRNGNVVGVVGISIDISDRKRMEEDLKLAKEQAETANKAKSEFLAAINHELRTPLTGMLGTARLLSTEPLEPEYVKQVDDIITAGQHLLELVNDLLDLSKLEAGKFELNNSPLDLRKLVEEVATMLSAQAKDRSLEIRVNYSADTPHLIMGDAKAIRQILLNLAGNAIKFTHEGYIELKVECVEKAKNNAKFKLSVNDTGIGIPTNKLNSVFERFNQVDNSRTRKYGGTGLGLTINKAYVELMGGTIEVQSEEGKGSSFICEVPFDLQSEDKLLSSWDPYKSKVRILIVDESSRADVVKKHIGSSYTEIVPCTDALNYLLTAQQTNQPFDIVIMDDELKAITADELAQTINQQKALKKSLLILMMKDPSLPKKDEAKEVGFFECLNKPVHPTELLASLTAAWEKWEERTKPQHPIEPITNRQLKILLVEDDPIIQKVHGMMLTKLGCEVDIAANGPKALEMYDVKYDAIFMDVGLGEMSGLETAQKIREKENSGNKRIPIIAMTGYGDEDSKASCLASGMDDLTVKPTTPEILKKLLEQWAIKEKLN